MRTSRSTNIVVGLFLLFGIAAFMALALQVSTITGLGDGKNGYDVTAKFTNIGGLNVRAPVTLAGVLIGRVTKIAIDRASYEAVVTLRINAEYNDLPEDSSASILTSGLIGEQYIGIDPGGAPDYLKNGSTIQITQSALVLEQLIGKFLTTTAEK